MTKKQFRLFVWSLLAMLGMTSNAMAAFTDIKADLRGTAMTSNDGYSSWKTFGVFVDATGSVSYSSTTDGANMVVSVNSFNGTQHGWVDAVATVAVEGPVKVTVGNCTYGGHTVTITDAASNVTSFETTAECWEYDPTAKVTYGYYKGTSATTLTIKCPSYTPYIAVEAVDASALVDEYTVSYAAGEGTGVVPNSKKLEAGKELTLPLNTTLYKEGATLTGWTDGAAIYAPGATYVVPSENVTLTAVYTDNTVSLADRTEPVTLKWNFGEKNGAGPINYEGKSGFIVTQATIGTETIDVKLDIDATSGKLNNVGRGDTWAQCNSGTKFTVPSCKGATVSMNAYNTITTTTIDGQTDYTQGNTISYEVAGSAETVEVVIGDGAYYSYLQVVLPVVASAGGKTYTDEAVTVEWPFNNATKYDDYTVTPDGTFSTVAVNPGDLTITGTATRTADNLAEGITFIKFKPAGSTTAVQWVAKPATGLTFTPTKVSMWIQRFSTDAENGVTITAKVGTGDAITLGNFTAPRANKSQAEDKYGKSSNWTNQVVIELTPEQQAALASGEELTLSATVGVGSTKEGGFSDVIIEGLLNGTVADVNKYTLDVVANPAEAGSVTKYPASDEYEEGTEVKLTATENFGYDFVNWTDATGAEVSKEPVFTYKMKANASLVANFKKVETYALALTVEGTNDYMVAVNPAPEVVDGKNMYEAGTVVTLTANQYEGLVTFNNWSDATTNSELTVTMDGDKDITAVYAEADIIAGWDFYKAGGNGRKADFAAADNDADALNLVKTDDGTTSGWLDKSTLGGGGYESFKGAAVNWRTGSKNGDVGNYHWQTKVNAEAFTDINVQFQMLYNYNAYQTYNAEYSLDGENWTGFGSITMEGVKSPASFSEKLPAAANNQKELYIRMIADKTSNVDGTASQNDGNTLAMFFITGTPKIVDDPVAPALVSSVPADKATGASATGKIVLTFDKKVQIAAGTKGDLSGKSLEPTVSGKTITFAYKNLEYATDYTFTLPANTVSNMTGATLEDAISISFTTMVRPSVTKGEYDAVVSTAEELLKAISDAENRSDKNVRFRIFIKNGEYTIPLYSTMKTVNGYEVKECITFINSGNISFIGESRDGVIITNGIDPTDTFAGAYGTTSKYDGIGNSDVFQTRGSGLYWQDLTVETGMDDATGRDLAIQDRGTKTIYKNVGLRGFQDTWTSNNDNGLYYFEGGYVRGRTDYMCGKGDAYFNGVELRQIAGGYAAVPSKPAKIGWVYKDCVINGESAKLKYEDKTPATAESADGNYTLGRPWGSGTPVAVFIDTKMNVVPSAIGWSEMSGGYPERFAEYNSMTKTGSVIDLSGRKNVFDAYEKDADGNKINERDEANNPVLTAEEAAEYSDMSRMYGDWQPTLATEQAPLAADVKLAGNKLTWTGNEYALLYAIVKNGSVVDFTTECEYTVDDASATYAIRVANEMGGLNEAVEATAVAEGESFAITIGEEGYRTFSCSKAIDFGTVKSLTVYQAKADAANERVILEEVESGKIAADQAVVLKGDKGTYTATVAASGDMLADNELLIAENDMVGDGTIYVLNKKNDKVGFYKLSTGSKLERGKGYLKVTSDARMLALSFGDDATGIDSVTRDALDGKVFYDLQGRRVLNPTKGVFIVNGKKVVIK